MKRNSRGWNATIPESWQGDVRDEQSGVGPGALAVSFQPSACMPGAEVRRLESDTGRPLLGYNLPDAC